MNETPGKPKGEKPFTRKAFMELPMDERRRFLAEQANNPEIIAYYKEIFEEDKPPVLSPSPLPNPSRAYEDRKAQRDDTWQKAQAIYEAKIREILEEIEGFWPIPQTLKSKYLKE